MTNADGSFYEGDWVADKKQGQGFYKDAVEEYEGSWQDDMKHGEGKQTTEKNGCVYVGSWASNQRDGFGVLTFPSGAKYEGSWSKGYKHGTGFSLKDGVKFEGKWIKDKKEGEGIETFLDGSHRKVLFKKGK